MWYTISCFLCHIGLHRWEFVDHSIDRELRRIVPFDYVCKGCGKGNTE